MQLSDFDFPFEESLIADHPVLPRDTARLLVVRRNTHHFQHHQVKDLPNILKPGDVLVLNDTKVMPARLSGIKVPGGGKVEVLLVKAIVKNVWEVLLKGHVDPGQSLQFQENTSAVVLERSQQRTVVRFDVSTSIEDLIDRIGEVPLPPYIKRRPIAADTANYQTVFAREKGSVAAPTAGLHFTDELLVVLKEKGIELLTITHHVGPGTFRPVRSENIQEHHMDPEWYAINDEAVRRINAAKVEGRRIIAVGTTVVRALETVVDEAGIIQPGSAETRLFIMPGYRFKIVDAMLTNFHLPRTTLIILVSAFAGLDRMRAAYQEALKERYRFYSYGDAMLIQ